MLSERREQSTLGCVVVSALEGYARAVGEPARMSFTYRQPHLNDRSQKRFAPRASTAAYELIGLE